MNKPFLTSLICIALFACNKESVRTSNKLGNDSVQSRAATNVAKKKSYIIMSKAGSLNSSEIEAKIAAYGAKVTNRIPALNTLIVSATDTAFYAALSNANVSIGINMMISKPSVPMFIADNPTDNIGNDEKYYADLWNMDAIDAPQAWNNGYTGEGAIVAVLDGGMALNSPDLKDNILLNKGKNFVNFADVYHSDSCITIPECDPSDPGFKGDPDGFSHASHVAGIIAAVDNGIGVIGVAPNAKIIPIKVISDKLGFGLTSWIAAGIVYAADNGANVINMSLGGYYAKGLQSYSNDVQVDLKLFNRALDYAYKKGVTVVVAVGNEGIDLGHRYIEEGRVYGSLVFFPAQGKQTIAVSATAPHGFGLNPLSADLDYFASYSNYGIDLVDVSAPGGDIFLPIENEYFPNDLVLSVINETHVGWAGGTSMASPHVAGVAALIVGKYNTMISPDKIKSIIIKTSDDLGKAGRDPKFGFGRVNANKATQQ